MHCFQQPRSEISKNRDNNFVVDNFILTLKDTKGETVFHHFCRQLDYDLVADFLNCRAFRAAGIFFYI